MRTYFFHPETNEEKIKQAIIIIKEFLERAGVLVITPETAANYSDKEFSFTGNLLEKVDGVIMEASLPNQELGYLLAYAIIQKKPTFCLYTRQAVVRELEKYLGKEQPKFLFFEHYQLNNLEKILIKFLAQIEKPTTYDDIPKIKFTLRLSPLIDKYLEWKTHNTKMTKAEFLRQEIKNKLIIKDEEYQKYLKRWREREGK